MSKGIVIQYRTGARCRALPGATKVWYYPINAMSNADTIPEFIKIKEVGEEYLTSRKTVERRRDRARATGDTAVYGMFRLRTKDGAILSEPTVEQVTQLTQEGRVPEWFVSRAWLEKEFGKRHDSSDRKATQLPDGSSDQAIREAVMAVSHQYEARINDLKEQLVAAARREEKAMEFAERDKQRFATATAQLTQVLALPGIAQATNAENQLANRSNGKDGNIVDGIGESGQSESVKRKRRLLWWRAE